MCSQPYPTPYIAGNRRKPQGIKPTALNHADTNRVLSTAVTPNRAFEKLNHLPVLFGCRSIEKHLSVVRWANATVRRW